MSYKDHIGFRSLVTPCGAGRDITVFLVTESRPIVFFFFLSSGSRAEQTVAQRAGAELVGVFVC